MYTWDNFPCVDRFGLRDIIAEMSKNEKESGDKKLAAIVIGGINSEDREGINLSGIVWARDEETAGAAVELLALETINEILFDDIEYIDADRSTTEKSKQFFFSAENWNAPWQPTGPTPPWRNKEGAIN